MAHAARPGCPGESIPFACQDWANPKAASRFVANHRSSAGEILGGHFPATRDRFAAAGGPVMILPDTSAFSSQRRRPEPVGPTGRVNSSKDKAGRYRRHTIGGLLLHASLAVEDGFRKSAQSWRG